MFDGVEEEEADDGELESDGSEEGDDMSEGGGAVVLNASVGSSRSKRMIVESDED